MYEDLIDETPEEKLATFKRVELRRKNVADMMYQGTPTTMIAEILGIDVETVRSDMMHYKKQQGDKIRRMMSHKGDVEDMLGTLMGQLEHVRENAMTEYSLGGNAAAKRGYLEVSLKATHLQQRLLVETGVLPKAGTDITMRADATVSFTDRYGPSSPLAAMDDDKKRRKVVELLGKVLRTTPSAEEVVDVVPLPASKE